MKLSVSSADRILIVGVPVSGKMPLAQDLSELYGLPIRHTDELAGSWSEVSETASRWFDDPPETGFIAVGMAVPRALRKWTRRNPEAPRPYSIAIETWEPRGEMSDEQRTMGRAAESVWQECQDHFSGRKKIEQRLPIVRQVGTMYRGGRREAEEDGVRLTLAERERACWSLSRSTSHQKRVRFTRIAPPVIDDEGRLRPDFALHLSPPKIVLATDGNMLPVDDLGRLHVRAFAVNPEEIVQAYGIRISWDAFSDTIHLFRQRPVMLAHHLMMSPIGRWPEQEISREGLTLGGWISSGARNTAWGDMQRLALDGVLDVSVSFFIDESEFDEEGGFLQVLKATLFEASLVSIPAMWSSFLDVAASWAKGSTVEQSTPSTWSAERWLRSLPDVPADPPRETRRQDRPSPELVSYSRGFGADVAEALGLARKARELLDLGERVRG